MEKVIVAMDWTIANKYILIALYELLVRLVPTKKNRSLVILIGRIIDLIPNIASESAKKENVIHEVKTDVISDDKGNSYHIIAA